MGNDYMGTGDVASRQLAKVRTRQHAPRVSSSTRGATLALVLVTLVSCGSSGSHLTSMAEQPPPSSTTTILAARTTSPTSNSYPDDPAALGSCPTTGGDTAGHAEMRLFNMPAQQLPSEVPKGFKISNAYTQVDIYPTDSSEAREAPTDEVSNGRPPTLVRMSGGVVTAQISLGARPANPLEMPEFNSTLRGKRASIKAEMDRGSNLTGQTLTYWLDGSTLYFATSVGLSDKELRALLERADISQSGVFDPSGELIGVGRSDHGKSSAGIAEFVGPVDAKTTYTFITLVSTTAEPEQQVSMMVVNERDIDPDWLSALPLADGRLMGLHHGEPDGREAFWGTGAEGATVFISTNKDGRPTSAYGLSDTKQLGALINSLKTVDPDDERLVGIQIGNSQDGRGVATLCRPDR